MCNHYWKFIKIRQERLTYLQNSKELPKVQKFLVKCIFCGLITKK